MAIALAGLALIVALGVAQSSPLPDGGAGSSGQASVLSGLPFDTATQFGANPLTPARGERTATRAYARLPLSFEPNRGQTDRRARFLARGRGYTLFLTNRKALLSLARGERQAPALLQMGFAGSSSRARITPERRLAGKVNYLVGGKRSSWRTNVPTYSAVRYTGLYPGIDLVYYGRGGRLEYDFHLAPGADPAQIVLRFRGARVRLARNGDLLLHVGGERVRQLRPVAYQHVADGRRAVTSRYELLGAGRVGLRLGRYDRARPLVIDPVLLYSTYLGGNGADHAEDIAVDGAGSAYVTGWTTSTNFPTRNPKDGTLDGTNTDVFVTKFDPSGGGLVYSTYLGGGSADTPRGIAVDGSGNAYVTGNTSSSTFPVENAEQSTIGGPGDAFVTKLAPSGSTLVYSTFLGGGNGGEFGNGIAVDGSGSAYVTGNTTSSTFPIQAAQQSLYGGDTDGFVTKFNPSGSAHVYSTFLGGGSHDGGADVAVDATGSAYVVGETQSTNFPTDDAQQSMNGGLSDAFVTVFNPSGSAHLYSTYLGGSEDEYGIGIAVDSTGNSYVTGETDSANFPVQNAQQPSPGGGFADAFVTKFNASGSAHVYSTYLGGGVDDIGERIAVDGAGSAYVTGGTTSQNFPLQGAVQPNPAGAQDAFVTQFNPSGSAHLFSTYLGGSGNDRGVGIAVDGVGALYLAGETASTNFPTRGPFQADSGGGASDAFVTKIGEPPPPPTGGDIVDAIAAVLSRFRLQPTTFPAAERGGSVAQRRRAGTRVSYTLSEPATVTFTVQRAARGRRVRGRCRRPTRRNRSRRRCVRYVAVRGRFRHVGKAGANRFRFTGRLRGRKLRRGRYRLGARAVDAAGNRSPTARRKFRIVRR